VLGCLMMSNGSLNALEKPYRDSRSYKVIRLSNDLEALLIHDPKIEKASSPLDVGVGYFTDLVEMTGPAQAVEHMLFMGTEKV
jgi:secreted Zn-dependent insulinase-like peptidase